MADTFLQNPIFTQYIFPFLLVFFIIFAILEKTKLFGENKKQINALIAFVIGLIFVGAIFPKLVVGNLVLFLTVTLVAVFVILLLWGFIFGDEKGFHLDTKLKWVLGILVGIAFVGALIWATGITGTLINFFNQNTGQAVWTNAAFVIVIAIALALILLQKDKKP